MPYDWRERAACRTVGVDTFFDDVGSVHGLASTAVRHDRWKAKQVCATCPVIQQCLDHAVRVKIPFGVYGGLDQKERAGFFGGIPTAAQGRGFGDQAKRAVIERFKYDGMSATRIMSLLKLTADEFRAICARRWTAGSQHVTGLREYKAWPAVYSGEPPLAIAARHKIPYERVLEMCKVVEKQPEYDGPRGYQRSVYWAETVGVARLDIA